MNNPARISRQPVPELARLVRASMLASSSSLALAGGDAMPEFGLSFVLAEGRRSQ
jgi:hypothetical protein